MSDFQQPYGPFKPADPKPEGLDKLRDSTRFANLAPAVREKVSSLAKLFISLHRTTAENEEARLLLVLELLAFLRLMDTDRVGLGAVLECIDPKSSRREAYDTSSFVRVFVKSEYMRAANQPLRIDPWHLTAMSAYTDSAIKRGLTKAEVTAELTETYRSVGDWYRKHLAAASKARAKADGVAKAGNEALDTLSSAVGQPQQTNLVSGTPSNVGDGVKDVSNEIGSASSPVSASASGSTAEPQRSAHAVDSRSERQANGKTSAGGTGIDPDAVPSLVLRSATTPNDIVEVRYAVVDHGDGAFKLMVELWGGRSLSKNRWSFAELASVLLEAAAGLDDAAA